MYLPPYVRMPRGTAFPPNPVEWEFFYRDDLHAGFIYNGIGWTNFQNPAIIGHGNEWHDPDFATEADLVAHIAATDAAIAAEAAARAAADAAEAAARAAAIAAEAAARAAAIAAHAGLTTGTHGVGASTIVGTALAQTITNKRNQPRVSSAASGNISPSVATADIYIRTAQAAALTINNPVGSPAQGEKLIIRLEDNGTGRAITFGAQYRALEYALPATTVAGKLIYMGFMFNSTDTKWDLIAINEE